MDKPKVNSEGQKQLDRAQEKFDDFKAQVEAHEPISARRCPVEVEPQTKLSKREISKTDPIHLNPLRSINSKEQFNEKYRKHWEKDWERVTCVVENYEIIGEEVQTWTKRYAGDPAHFWKVPVNKPVSIPRLLARQLSECKYNKLVMQDVATNAEGGMQYYGALAVEQTKHRIDAKPVNSSFSLSA